MLDPGQHITRSITARSQAGKQADRNPGSRGAVIRRINSAATIQRIGPGPANQRVIAKPAIERIGITIARQQIG